MVIKNTIHTFAIKIITIDYFSYWLFYYLYNYK